MSALGRSRTTLLVTVTVTLAGLALGTTLAACTSSASRGRNAAAPPAPSPSADGGTPTVGITTPPTTPTTTPPATPAGPGRCHTADLTARLRSLDSAAGSRYEALVLTNRSTRTCGVYGYGGVQLLDAARRPLPTQQVRDPSAPPHLVLLRPGASAYSRLHWSAIATDTESQTGLCEPTSTYLLITPPDETHPIAVAWSAAVCAHGRIGQTAYGSSLIPD
jgi:ABC-type transport system substrate-binding protein